MAEAPAELLQTALVAAYGISVGALVAEYAALRLLGERLSRRQGVGAVGRSGRGGVPRGWRGWTGGAGGLGGPSG